MNQIWKKNGRVLFLSRIHFFWGVLFFYFSVKIDWSFKYIKKKEERKWRSMGDWSDLGSFMVFIMDLCFYGCTKILIKRTRERFFYFLYLWLFLCLFMFDMFVIINNNFMLIFVVINGNFFLNFEFILSLSIGLLIRLFCNHMSIRLVCHILVLFIMRSQGINY